MKKVFKINYWRNAVSGRFITLIYIGLGILFFTTIFIFIKSIYDNKPVWETSEVIFATFKKAVGIDISLVYSIFIMIATMSLLFFTLTYKNLLFSNKSITQRQKEEKKLRSGINSAELFADRLKYAFPGQRGFKWYYSRAAVRGLEKLFKPPLKFGNSEKIDHPIPFWWFRSASPISISSYKTISKNKVLIGSHEFKIKRIGVFMSSFHAKSFIYVETAKEKQTGVNNLTDLNIKKQIDGFGCSFEEYGVLNENTRISKEHYEDGATSINGKIMDTTTAQLRRRYLSDYNFLIGANQSVFNAPSFKAESQKRMDSILKAEIKAEEFIERLKKYNNEEK